MDAESHTSHDNLDDWLWNRTVPNLTWSPSLPILAIYGIPALTELTEITPHEQSQWTMP